MNPPIHYPVSLMLADKPVLVVGTGQLARRRCALLRRAGAIVRILSPRRWTPADLRGQTIVFACARNRHLNVRIARQARQMGLWVNCHDQAAHSDFAMPAVVQRGSLVIAISTGGQSPALASRIRRDLEKRFGPEYASFLRIAGTARRDLKPKTPSSRKRARHLRALVARWSP